MPAVEKWPFEYYTPLHWATEMGQQDHVQKLLDEGVNLEAQLEDGSTALHIAAAHQFVGILELLLV